MFNIHNFIKENITKRHESLFAVDIENNSEKLSKEIEDSSILVIGGAGSIGSQFIKSVCRYKPAKLVVIDLSENGLVLLTRDLRSSYGMYVPNDYRTYTLDFANPIFERMFREEKGFDIVANFSAHKHVRSEKDRYSVQALIENNDIKAKQLLDLLCEFPPKHFFCVSTDKAANPVNIMGASKLVMEELIMAYADRFPITTARFANVAFSNGSLPLSFLDRIMNKQPLVAPSDVRRYFVSPEESGQICMLACVLGNSGEVFFPKLQEKDMMTFSSICDSFIDAMGFEKIEFSNDEDAKKFAAEMPFDTKVWPVVYSKSDTTGEKFFEEFFIHSEKVNLNRFQSLGVIEDTKRKSIAEVSLFFDKLQEIFSNPEFTKAQIVDALKAFIPNFEHEEKGKSLDQKM